MENKEEKKIIYYYYEKCPDKIYELEVIDELYVTGKTITPYLKYLVVNYDIDNYHESDYSIWLDVYNPYHDEEDIFVHDRGPMRNAAILSFNRDKIIEWFSREKQNRIKWHQKELNILQGNNKNK